MIGSITIGGTDKVAARAGPRITLSNGEQLSVIIRDNVRDLSKHAVSSSSSYHYDHRYGSSRETRNQLDNGPFVSNY